MLVGPYSVESKSFFEFPTTVRILVTLPFLYFLLTQSTIRRY